MGTRHLTQGDTSEAAARRAYPESATRDYPEISLQMALPLLHPSPHVTEEEVKAWEREELSHA